MLEGFEGVKDSVSSCQRQNPDEFTAYKLYTESLGADLIRPRGRMLRTSWQDSKPIDQVRHNCLKDGDNS